MKYTALAWLMAALLFLSACEDVSHIIVPPPKNQASAATKTPAQAEDQYTVLYTSPSIPAAPYEPENGCYLSAYIESSRLWSGDIAAYEKNVQKKHAVFMYDLSIDDPFPSEWMLRCIAHMKTPMVVIKAGEGWVFDAKALTETATAFGAYNIPLFIVFYPISATETRDSTNYRLYFRYARAIFAEFAPKAAFVWAADVDGNPHAYYPGDEAVDWVGLNLYAFPQTETPIEEALNDFYQIYQQDKPIMLAQWGVSHFSSQDFIYRTQEAAEIMEQLFTAVRYAYPRIKLINYMEVNGLEENDFFSSDNFSFTEDEAMLNTYQRLADDRYFLSQITTGQDLQNQSHQWLRSAYPARFVDGHLLIDENAFRDELGVTDALEVLTVGEVRYVDAATLDSDSDWLIIADHTLKTVNIYKRQ